MSSGEVFGILLMFGLVSRSPVSGGAFGLATAGAHALTRRQSLMFRRQTRQRAYLASLAIKREDGEAVMERLGITDPWAPSLSRERVSAGIDILVKRSDRKLTKEDRAKLREVEADRERRNPTPKLSEDEKSELLEAFDNFDENDPEYKALLQGGKKAPAKSKRLRPKRGSVARQSCYRGRATPSAIPPP